MAAGYRARSNILLCVLICVIGGAGDTDWGGFSTRSTQSGLYIAAAVPALYALVGYSLTCNVESCQCGDVVRDTRPSYWHRSAVCVLLCERYT